MESQLAAKCASKLHQITSAMIGPPAKINASPSAHRRNSTAGIYPPPQLEHYENSWARPPQTSTTTLAVARSPLTVSRRSAVGQQNLWLQRPGISRTTSATDWNSTSTDGDSEKKNHMAPQNSMIQVSQQSNTHRERNPSANVELKQSRLEQRTSSLVHRLRRLQYGQSRSHVEAESSSTNNSLRRALDNAASVRDQEALKDARALVNDSTLEQKLESLIRLGELRPDALNCEELRRASPAAMAQLLKKHEPLLKKVLASAPLSLAGVSTVTSTGSTLSTCYPPNVALDVDDREHLVRVTRSLQSHLAEMQREYDSDATESSSGGESCDEDEKITERSDARPSGKFRQTPLEHRASWQWWTERGWIGSRWAWIQFQLADLEYKIRQHVDLYKQLRSRKLKQIATISALNKKIRLDQKISDTESANIDDSSDIEGCARTRPYELSNSRRRLVKSVGMFRWNKKTLVRSTSHCECSPPFSPCVTCGGRVYCKEPVNVHIQTKPVRNSLLEPAYHPALSLPYRGRGIGLERKLQACMGAPKTPLRYASWIPQQKAVVTLTSDSRQKRGRLPKESPSIDGSPEKPRRKKAQDGPILGKRKYSMANRATAKLKRAKKFKRGWPRSLSITASSLSSTYQDDYGAEAGKLGSRRTTDRHSTFDIDNIIVDPRVAAVTRVEKIHYKEIQTPEWRIVEYSELSLAKLAQEKEMEDISDAAVAERHSPKETQEKKRFVPIKVRDLQAAARRGHLLDQFSSVDSNGSVESHAPTTPQLTSAASAPAGFTMIMAGNRPLPEVGTTIERGYDPFPTRHFPLENESVEGMCNGNGIVSEEKSRLDTDTPPSI